MSGSARARTHLAFLAAALVATAATPVLLLAQATGTVEGTVIDAGNKRPVPSVQVSIVGTGGTVGGLTNAQGEFRILNVAAGQRTVRLRRLGYVATTKAVDVTAGGTTNVAIEISPSAVELNAIVTTGTGGSQIEARKLGNTVATVEVPQDAPITNFSQILQGREPGVMALPSSGLTGEGSRIRIRGNASLSQSNEPIVYVDGVRIDNGGGYGRGFVGTGGGGTPSRLDDLDPTAIEKIEILKGAAAATLYGTEASNGVLLITTKKGLVGSPRWTFDVEQAVKSYPAARIEPQWGIARSDTQATRLTQHYGQQITAFTPFSRDVATQLCETGRTTVLGGQVRGGTPLVT
jgi:TonB-dependent SusC/RagA subfamily outer membrane receptor